MFDRAFSIVEKSIMDMVEGFLAHLPNLVIALLILLATWIISKVVDRVLFRTLSRSSLRESLTELFRKLTSLAVWVVGLLIAGMAVFPDFTPSKAIAAVGLGSVAIGFAFKDVFENFLAGILLLWREPFQLGDHIECDGVEGKVEEITIRDTYVRQTDGQLVVLPNAQLFKDPVTVRTDQENRRVSLTCGVAYDVDLDEASEIIREAVQSQETVNHDFPIDVFASEFGSSSVDFEVRWWTKSTPREVKESRDRMVRAIKRALDERDIEIPFPYRTLTFKEPLETSLLNQGEEPKSQEPQEAAAAG